MNRIAPNWIASRSASLSRAAEKNLPALSLNSPGDSCCVGPDEGTSVPTARLGRMMLGLVVMSLCFATETLAASPAGLWRGNWSSQSTGHQGPMRARVRQIDQHTYRALFVGRFAGVVPFVYPAKLERVPGYCDYYRSSQRLPLLGTYQMNATITPHRFHATFSGGDGDQGTFEMSRSR